MKASTAHHISIATTSLAMGFFASPEGWWNLAGFVVSWFVMLVLHGAWQWHKGAIHGVDETMDGMVALMKKHGIVPPDFELQRGPDEI